MKHCPTCGKSFDDVALGFCPVDGVPLIAEPIASGGPSSSPATFSSESGPRMPATQYNELLGKPTVSASQDQMPELQQYLAPKNQQTKPASQRKVWPWVVAGLVILFIIAAAIIGLAGLISAR